MRLPVSRAGQWFVLATCVVGLSACIDPQVGVRRTSSSAPVSVSRSSSQHSGVEQHIVQKGDTLYAIAFRYALDYRDIARWNGITEPFIIRPDQRLSLRDPTQSPAIAQNRTPAPVYAPQSSTDTRPAQETVGLTQIGTAAPTTQGVSVGAVVPESELSQVEPLSPTNAQGLPTGFVSTTEAPATAAAPPTSTTSAPVVAHSSMPTNSPRTDVPSAPPPEMMAPKPNTVAVIQAPTLNSGSSAKPPAGANGWGWPVVGRVLTTFSSSDPGRQGVDIAGNLGDSVHAAKGGDVVYSGRGIIGYGELIVIKHDDATLTAYGHNDKRSVKEGERVTQGQKIAEMGKAPNGQSLLHFEVRRNGKPVDPLSVLPARR